MLHTSVQKIIHSTPTSQKFATVFGWEVSIFFAKEKQYLFSAEQQQKYRAWLASLFYFALFFFPSSQAAAASSGTLQVAQK